MKVLLLITLTILVTNTSLYAQKDERKFPSFEELQKYAEMTNDDFRLAIKPFGFSFEERIDSITKTGYSYYRKTTVNYQQVREFLVHWQENDGYVYIKFISDKDLESMYLPAIQKNYTKMKCTDLVKTNEIINCYYSKEHICYLKEINLNDITRFTVEITKL